MAASVEMYTRGQPGDADNRGESLVRTTPTPLPVDVRQRQHTATEQHADGKCCFPPTGAAASGPHAAAEGGGGHGQIAPADAADG